MGIDTDCAIRPVRPEEWPQVKELRLAALRDPAAPIAFLETYEEAAAISHEDRRKHLEFIQAAIARMSAASITTKSWLIPLVTLTYGYSLTQSVTEVELVES
ncbi:hypothetical protein GL263_24485 [Streptomyces durbertensis]|uniref:Acetyltransferase n=1 Tax=Streptomyces durbertensis TaxID=2448886 RepID=A0ABR6EMV1_9ACTN|nr:hypothetical protein [Streptomyces durbertensis]MBB1246684.1 hypothetical protein [Streptomyces durbertensis]